MHVGVRWETRYHYSKPVRLLHTELRVLPAEGFGQHRLHGQVLLEPDAEPFLLSDAFGNHYHHVDFLQEVDRLWVTVEAEVDTPDGPVADPNLPALYTHLYRQPSHRSPFAEAIAPLGTTLPEGDDPVAAAEAVVTLLGDRFAYDVGPTDVRSTATDLVEGGRGVCQDFTHLALSLLRQRGHVSRYVSGYLASGGDTATAEASHAWFQVYDGAAWHGFDPANRCAQDGRYVVTAVGRDYDDVPPLRGTYHGLATEEWSTSVSIHSRGV